MITQTLNFTKKALDTLEAPGEGHQDYQDEQNRHLRLRITQRDTRSFYLVRRVKGKTVFKKLGRFPEITVSQARSLCAEEGLKLLNGEEEEEKAKPLTFSQLFDRYMEEHAKPHKRTWQEDQRQYDRYLQPLYGRLAGDIDRETINKLHKSMETEHGPYMANRTLALLKKVYNFGIQYYNLESNPCQYVKHFKETRCERWMNGDELPSFFNALDHQETPGTWRDFFRLALFTGVRRSNLAAMRWDAVDLTEGVWTIPAEESKNGEPLHIILCSSALEILRQRQTDAEKSKYVFPSHGETGHIVEPQKAWKLICDRAGISNLKIHDLRRTLGSWMAKTGAGLQIIGRALGHHDSSVTSIYARLDDTETRKAIETAVAAMLETAEAAKKKAEAEKKQCESQ
ncbi:MAG: tyrosine-type recombinase/integrase [Candidatus Pacebacteria bacterium]|nr:tyrosine-type recombinase/integrase [Candidatus Paceibacterota bacterium]